MALDEDKDFIPDFVEDLMGADLFRKPHEHVPYKCDTRPEEEIYDISYYEINFDQLNLWDFYTVEGIKYEITDTSIYSGDEFNFRRFDGTAENKGSWLKVEKDGSIVLYNYVDFSPTDLEEEITYNDEKYTLKKAGILYKESDRGYDDDNRDSQLDKTSDCFFYENMNGMSLMLEETDNFTDASLGKTISILDVKFERVKKTPKQKTQA